MKLDNREILANWWDIFPCYPAQRRFIESNRRNTLFLAGIGSGKSHALTLAVLRASMINGPGVDSYIFGRTGPDLTNVLKPSFNAHREAFAKAVGIDPVWRENRSTNRYKMIWGGEIVFRPYDQIETVRGISCAVAAVDEVDRARVDAQEAFEVISGRIRDPRAVYKRLFLATTPNGLQGSSALFLRMQQAEKKLTQKLDIEGLQMCAAWQDEAAHECGECERCKLESARGFRSVRATLLDNPYIDAETKRAMSAGRSRRQYMQEIMGIILAPTDGVFSEYNEAHVIDWKWRDDFPYVLGVDWGTTTGYFCLMQVLTRELTLGDRVLPAGSWIVAQEKTLNDVSRSEMRQEIWKAVQGVGRHPVFAGADRAVVEENRWLRKTFPNTIVTTMRTREEQRIIAGVECMRWMLAPYDSKTQKETTPRLYTASSLTRDPTTTFNRGIRDALHFYSYQRIAGVLTNTPSRSPVDPNKHCIDAVRYAVYGSRHRGELHGGRPLPFTSWQDDRPG